MNFKLLVSTLILLCLAQPLSTQEVGDIVESLEIIGAEKIPTAELPHAGQLQMKAGRPLDPALVQQDLQTLYLTGHFASAEAKVLPKKRGVALSYVLTENPLIQGIGYQGVSKFRPEHLTFQLKNKPGRRLNSRLIQDDIHTLTELYHKKGYSQFEVQDIALNEDNTMAIQVSEGHIGKVSLQGLRHTRPIIVQRELSQVSGAVLNTHQLEKDRERLLKLGYFSSVSAPILRPGSKPGNTDISYQFTEKKLSTIDLGLEQLRNEDAVAAFAQFQKKHTLIYGDEWAVKTQLQIGSSLSQFRSYSTRYRQPWFMNKFPISMTWDLWRETRNEALSNTDTIHANQRDGAAVQFSFPLNRDTLTLSTRYKTEEVTARDGASFTPYALRSLAGILRYDTRTDTLNPRAGHTATLSYERGGEIGAMNLGGLSFSRWTLNSSKFFATSTNGTLAMRAFYGEYKKNDSTPTFESEEFSLGGAGSLRGYHELQFSGPKRLLFNLEYRHSLNQDWQAVLFLDSGKVFTDSATSSQYKTGAGIGIRYLTGIVPFRMDLAWGEQDLILHFSLGQMF